MKSVALSLLVALGLTLGSQVALADVPARAGASLTTSGAQESMAIASQHASKALAHREAARQATKMAGYADQIAADDAKQGFAYAASVEREKARQYRLSAQTHTAAAEREEAAALYYRNLAAKQMASQRPSLKAVPRG